jgi:hypothetical protein
MNINCEPKYMCLKCNRSYSSKQSLWNHKKIKHINVELFDIVVIPSVIPNNKKKYNCKICNNEFTQRCNKWRHEQLCKKKNNINITNNNKLQIVENKNIESEKSLKEIKNMLNDLLRKNNKIQSNSLNKIKKQINNCSDTISELSLDNNICEFININNYIEEDLEKYYNKDCVYIINIRDNIYKYGRSSHIFKRLQAHKTNLNYKSIIKIYQLNNMNETEILEKKIKNMVKTLNINRIYNNQTEIFQIDKINLQDIINKIDDLSLKLTNKDKIIDNKIEVSNKLNIKELEVKSKELDNEKLRLEIELLKLQKK